MHEHGPQPLSEKDFNRRYEARVSTIQSDEDTIDRVISGQQRRSRGQGHVERTAVRTFAAQMHIKQFDGSYMSSKVALAPGLCNDRKHGCCQEHIVLQA
jgi:hypothetical protein